MAPKRSLKERPLDAIYYTFFLIHLLCSLTVNLLVIWPTRAQTIPGLDVVYRLLKGVVDDYMTQTNDPFMLVNWGLVERPWEFAYLKVFLCIEAFIQVPSFIMGMIGLQKDSASIYPLLLAYSSTAIVTTATYMHAVIIAPSLSDTTLDPLSKFYAMSDKGRWTILNPTIVFLLVPGIMWVDMMVRLGRLVKKGAQVEAQRGRAVVEKNGKAH